MTRVSKRVFLGMSDGSLRRQFLQFFIMIERFLQVYHVGSARRWSNTERLILERCIFGVLSWRIEPAEDARLYALTTRIFVTRAVKLLGKDCIVSFLSLRHTILLIWVHQLLIVTRITAHVDLSVLKRGHGRRLAGHVGSSSHFAHTAVWDGVGERLRYGVATWCTNFLLTCERVVHCYLIVRIAWVNLEFDQLRRCNYYYYTPGNYFNLRV